MEKKKGQISLFRETNTEKKKISPVGLALVAVIIIAAAYFVVSGIRIIQLNQELAEAEKINQELSHKKEDLLAEYENVSSPQYIERVARRDLMLVKGNELLFILPDKKAEKPESENEDKATATEEGKDETEDEKTED
ncbi:MAG: septum formation initiator family protein [Firmicutes bacterium]|nr:septum formation initiator family protein [Bacillota bacterium]